jgi:hypothetical protein
VVVAERPGDAVGLVGVVVVGDDDGHRAVGPVGPQRPAAAAGQHRRGDREDLGARSVVVVHLDDRRSGEVVGEPGEVRRVGPVPAVDGLVGVTHDTEVVAVAEPTAEQPELQRVHVLELVDEEVAEPPALRIAERAVGLQGGGAMGQEVVEVDEALALLLLLVPGEPLRHDARRSGDPAGGGGGGRGVPVGRDEPGLRPLDLGRQLGGAQAVVSVDDRPQDAGLVLQQCRRAAVAPLPPGAELRPGRGVERAGGRDVAQPEAPEPAGQLAGRLAGEGEGQDMAWIGVAGDRPPGDAPGEDPGLARARAGLDAQRVRRVGDSPPLVRVEPHQQRVGVHPRRVVTGLHRLRGAPPAGGRP